MFRIGVRGGSTDNLCFWINLEASILLTNDSNNSRFLFCSILHTLNKFPSGYEINVCSVVRIMETEIPNAHRREIVKKRKFNVCFTRASGRVSGPYQNVR